VRGSPLPRRNARTAVRRVGLPGDGQGPVTGRAVPLGLPSPTGVTGRSPGGIPRRPCFSDSSPRPRRSVVLPGGAGPCGSSVRHGRPIRSLSRTNGFRLADLTDGTRWRRARVTPAFEREPSANRSRRPRKRA
jgi:hypothetical protein